MKSGWIVVGSTAAAMAAVLFLRRKPREKTNSGSIAPSIERANVPALKNVVVPTAMAAGTIAAWMRLSHGNTLKYTFVPSMAVSWALYMRFLRKRMPDPEKLVPLYLLSLAWQFVHFVEENSTGFRYRWPLEIFGTRPYGSKQYVAINALSYAVFLAGGVALLRQIPAFSLPAVFFAVMGVMYNGVQHPIYSIKVKGYFPGLWTGLVDLFIGPILLRRLLSPPQQLPVGTEIPVAA
jgi:hypothetical protein